MLIQTRNSVFETNSSSSHSVTVNNDEVFDFNIDKDKLRNGVIEVELGAFGWEWFRYRSLEGKMAYLITQLGNSFTLDGKPGADCTNEVRTSPRVDKMLSIVEAVTGCKVSVKMPDTESPFSVYVDHESYGNGLELFNSDVDLKNFLFNQKSFIQTGNDNDNGPEMIPNDLDQNERLFEEHYANELADTNHFELNVYGDFSEVNFMVDDFELQVKADFFNRGSIMSCLNKVVIESVHIKFEHERQIPTKEDVGEALHEFLSDINEFDDASIKIYEKASKTFSGMCNHYPDLRKVKFEMTCSAPEDTIANIKQAILDIASANNKVSI